ncbi:hypothetical protein B9G98_03519 [Wickerhamiella sorbophila]|uniref:Uncharacterized protein n=1 Tax=Wickerhamiella sorbophila TaxID=45607 RepID=A0A2T0FLP2_9ASCO|nr:hypothetical protein B9G98_03519 [Wickerhamiella sorbophila]PRT55899.1 hypothetical protein B9G98_03519 [Wickerhamiella sorbophila]
MAVGSHPLIRDFHFSAHCEFMGPYRVYEKPSRTAKIMSYVPQPIKVFGSIAMGAALTVFLAPALVIIFAPPLIMGWIYYRRRLNQLKRALNDQRWADMSSYNLTFEDASAGGSPIDSIPYPAKSRIYNAIQHNEQNLASSIGVPPDSIKYTGVESLYQDFKTSNSGLTETIQIQQFGILSPNGRRLGTVSLVVLGDPAARSKKMRIEINPARGKTVVLTDIDNDDDSNVIIDVKKH